MDASRHASLGRKTLEEIRQKRAAERLRKTSSGPDLNDVSTTPIDGAPIRKSESGNRLSETDVGALYSQLKSLQNKNTELEESNKILSLKLQTKDAETGTLQTRLNELEQNTVPSLRKALKEVAMEKDAAVVLREDLSTQLRTLKKQLKNAEEEQYRAEEDAAALRAELNMLQQQAMNDLSGAPAVGALPDQIQSLEKDLLTLKFELQQESELRQREQQYLAEEQARSAALVAEKQELDQKLAALSKTVSESTHEKGSRKGLSLEDREKLEKQLHDMAVAVERLEISRQKLLKEIDDQSSEIERLFEENSNLSLACQEAANVAKQWEKQVKECLSQNDELRRVVEKLRTEQANSFSVRDTEGSLGGASEAQSYGTELLSLKSHLAKEQSKTDTLSAQVLQLSAQLQQVTQTYNGLARLYKPVLRNIESSLIKLKQEGSLTVP